MARSSTPKTIIVTGAQGYIGRYCCRFLAQRGFWVHGLSRQHTGKDADGVLWHKMDLLSERADRLLAEIRPSHCLHLAWCTEPGVYWTSDDNHRWRDASDALLKDFIGAGGQRFVTSGTCAEYRWGGVCEEGVTPDIPATLYGRCKKAFSDALLAANISTANGRVFFLYGPTELPQRLVPSVITSMLKNEPVRCTDGKQVRDFMFVADVAEGIVSLVDSTVTGVVNIASGEARSVRSVIETLRDLLHPKAPIEFGAVARGASDPDVLTATSRRLNHEVGFFPRVSLEDGLRASIASIRTELTQKP